MTGGSTGGVWRGVSPAADSKYRSRRESGDKRKLKSRLMWAVRLVAGISRMFYFKLLIFLLSNLTIVTAKTPVIIGKFYGYD